MPTYRDRYTINTTQDDESVYTATTAIEGTGTRSSCARMARKAEGYNLPKRKVPW